MFMQRLSRVGSGRGVAEASSVKEWFTCLQVRLVQPLCVSGELKHSPPQVSVYIKTC